MTQTVLLGDEIELAYGKGLPQRSRVSGAFPVFGSNGQVDTHNKLLIKGPGIIVGRKGSVGEVIWTDDDFWPIDTTYYVKLKNKNDSLKYWYYQLKTLDLNQLNSHSAIPGLNRDVAYSKQVIKRTFDEQKKIANTLSSLDQKIELNRKMNETLEQIGQALFRHYFVDNVEAEIVKVTDLLSFERGVEPGSKNYSESDSENSSPFLRVGDLSQRKSSIFVDNNLLKNKFVKPSEVLVSFDGNPGLVAIGLEGSYSTGIRKVVLKDKKLSAGYAYFLMKSDDIQNTIDRYSEGTTIKHAPRAIENMTTIIPENISGMIELQNILDTLVSNLMQIQTLTTLRDTLLPRLISGKIEL